MFAQTVPFYATAGLVALSIMLGGGTRSGFLGDAVLQLISLPLLWLALTSLVESHEVSRVKWPLFGLAAIVALPLLQLIPLPPAIWTALPGRSAIVETYRLLGDPLPFFPLTVSPEATWLCLLGLVPAIAIFLAMLILDYEQRRLVSIVFAGAAVVSVFLGLLQLADGVNSTLRFYAITNTSEAVGFFANRNHFAALLYAATLFCFCWLIETARTFASKPRSEKFDAAPLIVLCMAVIFILMAGQLMARSRAGLILFAVVLAAGFIMAMKDRGARERSFPRFLFVAIAIAIVVCSQFALFRILDRFGPDTVSDARLAVLQNTISAARAYMPLGSGLGTFVPVYQTFETPRDLTVTYVNHAHNDLLELWLEAGLPGLVLLLLFIFWLSRRAVAVWAGSYPSEVRSIDRNIMKAAAIAAGLLLVHSLVDYPLRTSANLAVMAFCLGLLVPPLKTGQTFRRTEALAQGAGVPRSSAKPPMLRQRVLWCNDSNWPRHRRAECKDDAITEDQNVGGVDRPSADDKT